MQCVFATALPALPLTTTKLFSKTCFLFYFFDGFERRQSSGDKIYGRHRGGQKNTSDEMRAAAAVAATTDDKQIWSDLSPINAIFFLSVPLGTDTARRKRRCGSSTERPQRGETSERRSCASGA